MKKSKFTEEQIAYALRQVEAGTPPADICRQLGVSEATFYIWKKKYAHLGVSELRRLRSLEDEDNRLKRLVADLTLDKHMLAEALRKRVYGPSVDVSWLPGSWRPTASMCDGPVTWHSSAARRGIADPSDRIKRRSGHGFRTFSGTFSLRGPLRSTARHPHLHPPASFSPAPRTRPEARRLGP